MTRGAQRRVSVLVSCCISGVEFDKSRWQYNAELSTNLKKPSVAFVKLGNKILRNHS